MKRIGVLIVFTLLAATGCGSKEPALAPPRVTPSSGQPSSPASATPTASPSALIEFSVDGAGPYQLGTTLAELQSAASLDEVKVGGECPGITTARGTGVWTDIWLSFRNNGELYLLINRSPSIPTPSGAWLGTTLAELKTIYARVATQELKRGAETAFLVTTLGGRGLLFQLDAGRKVISMLAGNSGYLRNSYLGGKFC